MSLGNNVSWNAYTFPDIHCNYIEPIMKSQIMLPHMALPFQCSWHLC